ncbi:MAG: UbiH/UbiF/VisC/COQ6 family ubiquinone biosynthesis hydroxylase [Pseudomonadota bacterium]
MKPDCDVLISGGGLVGLSLACELATKHMSVRVLEAAPPYEAPSLEGLRVSAINPRSQALLDALGAWQSIAPPFCSPFERMRVWDEAVTPFGDRALEFSGADCGVTPLGHIVHNDALQWSLYQQASAHERIELVFNSMLEEVVHERDGVRVFDTGHAQHTARLLVGADGMRSQVRALQAIKVVQKSYAQQGIVCTLRPEHGHERTAWQRFLSTGPIALLPLASGDVSVVWSLDNEAADSVKALDDDAFCAAVTDACDGVLGGLTLTSQRATFPLGLLRAERYVGPRVALIGDAAHVVHPLAGQGVNLGFGDVAELAGALDAGRERGDGVGDQLALRQYERARKYENRKMQMTIDALHHMFTQSQPVLRQGRSLGMGLLNNWPGVKSLLAREALGTR